jgi:beta-hydroxylase
MTKSMKAGARHRASATIWHESGDAAQSATLLAPQPGADDSNRVGRVATLHALPAARASLPPATCPDDARTLRHRIGRLFDGLIASQSLAATDPVLDVRDFAWTALLRRDWRAIREEAVATAQNGLTPLWRDGAATVDHAQRCPHTLAALHAIPGLYDAAFATLAPGIHIPARRGATKGLITCHLGLVVPRDGGARMRVRDRILRWAEGETLIFDDSFDHEIHNDAGGQRIVLRIRFARPLRRPGQWAAAAALRLLPGRI